jgi:hypothetical protein
MNTSKFVVLAVLAMMMLGLSGCMTNDPQSAGPIPWDRPDILDVGAWPSGGGTLK